MNLYKLGMGCWVMCLLFVEIYSVPVRPTVRSRNTRQTQSSSSTRWTTYSFCPENSFVNGVGLIFQDINQSNINQRHFPAYGLNISCSSIHLHEPDTIYEDIPYLGFNDTSEQFSSKTVPLCALPESANRMYGMAVGIEKRIGDEETLLDISFYCNYPSNLERIDTITKNIGITEARWSPPDFCPWGQYICGFKQRYHSTDFYLLDVRTMCCFLLLEEHGWVNYRGATEGKVISSIPMITSQELYNSMRYRTQTDYMSELDHPYFYKWKFCPVTKYVTGLQAQIVARQFSFSCTDISQPAPRTKSLLVSDNRVNGDDQGIWEAEEELSPRVECDGVAIGFQILYEESTKQIQGMRLFCSYSGEENKLPYIKSIFPGINSTNAVYSWGNAEMCKSQQAICGFKAKSRKGNYQSLSGMEHIKAKCCNVPQIAQICAPYDRYELVVECDSRKAMADTSCQYTLSEGITISQSQTGSYRRGEDMRESLTKEWSLSQGVSLRDSEDRGGSSTNSSSFSTSNSVSNSSSSNVGSTSITGTNLSKSKSNSKTNNRGISRGTTNSKTIGSGRDKTDSSGTSSTFSDTFGESLSSSLANSLGQSTNYLNTKSNGISFSDSRADTVGSSTGSVSATTVGSGSSRTKGRSTSQSESSSNTDTNSHSRGNSFSGTAGVSLSVGAEAGVNIGIVSGSVKTNLETSFSATMGTTSDSSQSSSSTTGRESSSSTNSQETFETNQSKMDQRTHETQTGTTINRGKDTRKDETAARGGEQNQQSTDTNTRDKNYQHNTGGQRDNSFSNTNRENRESTFTGSNQFTDDFGTSQNEQVNYDVNRSKQGTRNDENTNSVTRTDTAENSNSETQQYSRGRGSEMTNSKGQTGGHVKDKSFTTGYDWSNTSGRTWTVEKTYEVSMTVPAGFRTRLYQVVGHCANFQVRTNNFRRVDEVDDWAKPDRFRNVVAPLE